MSCFQFWVAFIVLVLGLSGCGEKDEESDAAGLWRARMLWPCGSRPVPAPVGDAVLFTVEGDSAGLYLYAGGVSVCINEHGPAARMDYSWSRDGAMFCFSSPGLPGEGTTGIYYATRSAPTHFLRIWDRGTHPRFMPNSRVIVCAGPTTDSLSAGIWQIEVLSGHRELLTSSGESPEVSRDGLKIAFLSAPGPNGGILTVLDLATGRQTQVAGNVLNFSWLGDSQTLVYETTQDGSLQLFTVRADGRDSRLHAAGTHPAGFPEGGTFAFVRISLDRTDGIWIGSPTRSPERISFRGTWPVPANTYRVVAQDSLAIIELTR